MPRRRSGIQVKIEGEADFSEATRDIKSSGARMEAEAKQTADAIDASFRQSGRKIGDRFASAEADVRKSLGDVERQARRSADDTAKAFDRAGDEINDSLSDIGSNLNLDSLGSNISDKIADLGSAGGPVLGAIAGVGVLFGDEIAAGFDRGFSAKRRSVELSIKTGLSGVDLEPIGRAAGAAYSAGFGESLSELTETASLLQGELSAVDDSLDLNEATKQAQILQDVLGVELPQSINLTRRLVSNGLVGDTQEAFNLIASTAQKFRLNFEDILDVASEFAPVFSKLEIDGARAFDIIGTTVQEGLLPNVDRAAELFEEFNIRLSEAETLQVPIENLGLSFQDMQAALANGRGDEALARIAEALLAMEDPVARNAAALEIFGASIESASDPERVIELLALADATGEVSTAMEDAAARSEELVGYWTRQKREAEDLAAGVASIATSALEAYDAYSQWLNEQRGLEERSTEQIDGIASSLGVLSNQAAAASVATGQIVEPFEEMERSASEAAIGVRQVTIELNDLFNFSADQLLRNIATATDGLAEALANADVAAFGLNGQIDIAAEGGAAAQQAFEQFALQQQRNIQLFNEGKISGDQFAGTNAIIERNLRQVLSQSELTERQIDDLIDKYLATPGEVRTVVTADDRTSGYLNRLEQQLARIRRGASFTVRGSAAAGGVTFRAAGGPTEGLTVVGEHGTETAERGGRKELVGVGGPQLMHFSRPTMIRSHKATERALGIRRMADGGVSFAEQLAIVGDNVGARSDPEITTPESRIEKVLRSVLADEDVAGGGFYINQVVVPEGEDIIGQLERARRLHRPRRRAA